MKNKLIKIFSVMAIIIMVASATVLPTLAEAPDELFTHDVLDDWYDPASPYHSWYVPPCFDFNYGGGHAYLDCYDGRPGSFELSVYHYMDFTGQFVQVNFDFRGCGVPHASIYYDITGYTGRAFYIANDKLYLDDGTELSTFNEEFVTHLTYWIDVDSLNIYYFVHSDDPFTRVSIGSYCLYDNSTDSSTEGIEFFRLVVDGRSDFTGSYEFHELSVSQLPNPNGMTSSSFSDTFNGYSNGFSEGYEEGFADGDQSGYNSGWADGNEEGYDEGYDWGYEVGHGDGYESGSEDGYQNGYTNGETMGYINGYEQGEMDGIDRGYADGFSSGWQEGFEESVHNFASGYDKGFAEGKTEGYKDGYSATMDVDTAYANGYTDGYETAYKENYEETVNKISPNEGTLTQGFLAGMWNGTQNFVQEILDGVTFSGLSLRAIVTTCVSLVLAVFIIRLLKG